MGKGYCGIPDNETCGKYHNHSKPDISDYKSALEFLISGLGELRKQGFDLDSWPDTLRKARANAHEILAQTEDR